jgi:hypothetical protein
MYIGLQSIHLMCLKRQLCYLCLYLHTVDEASDSFRLLARKKILHRNQAILIKLLKNNNNFVFIGTWPNLC